MRPNSGLVTYPGQNTVSANVATAAGATTSNGSVNVVTSVVGSNGTPVKVQLQQRNDCAPTQAATPSSPILKAQLSAPPKPAQQQQLPPDYSLKAPIVTSNILIEPKSQVGSLRVSLSLICRHCKATIHIYSLTLFIIYLFFSMIVDVRRELFIILSLLLLSQM